MELELELCQSPSPAESASHARGGLAGVQVTALIWEACTETGSNEETCGVPSTNSHPSSA